MAPMEEIVSRCFTHLLERPSSPLNMRFLLQPAVAIYFGVRAGMSDAKLRRGPYFRTVVLEKEERPELIGEALDGHRHAGHHGLRPGHGIPIDSFELDISPRHPCHRDSVGSTSLCGHQRPSGARLHHERRSLSYVSQLPLTG